MKIKTLRKVRSNIIYGILVVFFLFFTMGPIVWSFIISITPDSELTSKASILPRDPVLRYYKQLFLENSQEALIFKRGFKNSLIAATLSIIIGIPIAVLTAYPLSRLRFKGRELIKNFLLVTLVIPAFATIIPLYKMFSVFSLIDTQIGLVLVYVSAFLPLSVWLIMSYFETLPKEIIESAQLDGCGQFMVLLKIILPVSYPVIFAAVLIVFLSSWNQFLVPLILAPSYAAKPITVVISEFVTKTTTKYGLMNAGGIVTIIPPAIVAVVFRQLLIEGMVSGATKG